MYAFLCVIFFYAYIFLSDIGNIFEVSTNLLIVISSRKQIREGQAGAGERIGKNKKMLLLTLSPYIVCIFFFTISMYYFSSDNNINGDDNGNNKL